MFHNRSLKRLHEKQLRIIYNDKQSSFEQLLNQNSSVSIHHRNIQVLAIELYKTVDDTAPQIIKEVFKLHEGSNCNLRHFIVPRINTVYHGIESASFLVSKFGD